MKKPENSIDSVLEQLQNMSESPGYFTHFAFPAKEEKITHFEKKFGVKLPKSHKKFLLKYNGGMILHDYQSEFLQTHADYEMYKHDAVYFLSIEEITGKYADLKSRSWKVFEENIQPYPIIPFCSLPNNELLIFVHGKKSGDESPVFDAFHEEFPTIWGMVAPDFTSFLKTYLEKLGRPDTLGDDGPGVADDYFDRESIENDKETPQETLRRTEEELTSNQLTESFDKAFAHYERSLAHKDLGDYSEAYLAITRAIEQEPKDPFYYFFRGEILTDTGQHRAALIDYDVAVKLKPDDTLYLCCRATSLYYLNKLKPSIDDCNSAIELDSSCTLAYMIRKQIYEIMGMEDKAEMDQMIIDKLKEEE